MNETEAVVRDVLGDDYDESSQSQRALAVWKDCRAPDGGVLLKGGLREAAWQGDAAKFIHFGNVGDLIYGGIEWEVHTYLPSRSEKGTSPDEQPCSCYSDANGVSEIIVFSTALDAMRFHDLFTKRVLDVISPDDKN